MNAHFEELFAVGVDEMSWDDMANDHFEWPPVSQVRKRKKKPPSHLLDADKKTTTTTMMMMMMMGFVLFLWHE